MLIWPYVKPYLLHLSIGSTALMFIYAGVASFGNGLLFDRLVLGALIFALLLNLKNINILGVILIFFVVRLIDEAGWQFSEIENMPDWYYKCLYIPIVFIFWKLRYNQLKLLTLTLLMLCAFCELYWAIAEYNGNVSGVVWVLYLVAMNILFRHAILIRLIKTEEWFPNKAETIKADFWLRDLSTIQIGFLSFELLEYLLRHLGLTDSILFYSISPYASQVTTVIIIWLIVTQSLTIRFQRILPA